MRPPIKKITFIGVLTALGIVLSIIENVIPVNQILPGAKLGLANIVTMVAFPIVGPAGTLFVLVLRIVVSALLTGRLGVIAVSFSGGLAAYIVMLILYKTSKLNVSFVGISISGAVFHAVGQILAAIVIVGNAGVVTYLPLLLLTSSVTGFFTGVCSNLVAPVIKRYSI